jgi:FkbM family methyltransferase
MENIPVIRIFNKLGGIDYTICERKNIIEGANNIDYFVTKDGIKYKVDGYSNFMVKADCMEYDLSDIKPDDIVLDIGTTIGDFTIAAALKAKHVYAVEPLFCKELGDNLKLNNITNVTILPFAIGNGNNIDLSFNKVELKNVPTYTLTNIINMIQLHSNGQHKISFLKCDCEGGEWYIKPSELDGIRCIEMEIHPREFPTEVYNRELVPYIKQNWNTTITLHDDMVFVIHAKEKFRSNYL